jgi:hypothetical protein
MPICFDHDVTIDDAHRRSGSAMQWIEDALAGLGLLAFMAAAFVLAAEGVASTGG